MLGNDFITGDITSAEIKTADAVVEMSRIGVARARHHRAFAQKGDGGTPVISRTRALMGFIVAKQGQGALVLPAEQLAESFGL